MTDAGKQETVRWDEHYRAETTFSAAEPNRFSPLSAIS